MGDWWPSIDLRDLLGGRPTCGACLDSDDVRQAMEPTEVFDPSQQLRVSAWECPRCGETVYRDTGDGVELYDPPQ